MLKAFGILLPEDVEKEILIFIQYGIGETGLFTSKALIEGVIDLMKTNHPSLDYTENWPRRVIDAFIKREKEAGNIAIFGAEKGPHVMWHVIKKD